MDFMQIHFIRSVITKGRYDDNYSIKNNLFQEYIFIPSTSNDFYKNDTTAFLFTLTNSYNILSRKYLIQTDKTG